MVKIKEITDAAISPGEEETLKQQKSMAKNKESFLKNCAAALEVLYENNEGMCAYNFLSEALRSVETAAESNKELEKVSEQLSDIRYSIEDIIAEIRRHLEEISDLAFSLEDIEARLDTIYRLKRKYGNSEEEILAYCQKAQAELETIETADERKAELIKQIACFTEKAKNLAEKNHKIRTQTAREIEKRINEELSQLNMEGAIFSVQIAPCDLNKNGKDKVEFLLSANKGEPLKPLCKIVSGGELSRIMLALKHVLSAGDIASTLIFDEIDSGISGRAAGRVGEKLREISKKKQVFCVTHLPQIAALSDRHFKISKNQHENKTVTKIEALSPEEKTKEIALMIGGDFVTDTTLAQAADMIRNSK